MKMTNSNLNAFREDLKAAVSELERKYGVTIKPGGISYTEDSFNLKMEVVNEGGEERAYNEYIDRMASWDEPYSKLIGKFGQQILVQGKIYQIVGAKPSSKYDIVVKDLRNRKLVQYKAHALISDMIVK